MKDIKIPFDAGFSAGITITPAIAASIVAVGPADQETRHGK